jgi:hypothetical protein
MREIASSRSNPANLADGTCIAEAVIMRIGSATIVLAACATTATTSMPNGGPRGLRASDHLDAAAQHDQQAAELSSWPETSMLTPGGLAAGDRPITAMPWYRSWDTASDHERLAAIHRSQAATLEAAYEQACGDRPAADVKISPLVRYGVGGWPTANGAIIYLSRDAGTPDQLLAAMKCHRAFMMLAPRDMDDCTLDVPGLVLDARGDADGVTVSLTVTDRAFIPELKRRVAHDLEIGQRR